MGALSAIVQECVRPGMFALTFDDGPSDQTLAVLQTLQQFNVKATFFVVGTNVDRSPTIVRSVYNAGHQIALHSYSHPYFSGLSEDEARGELDRQAVSVYSAIGVNPRFFRFPFGDSTTQYVKLVENVGYTIAGWDIDVRDFERFDSQGMVAEVQSILASSSSTSQSHIALFHDSRVSTTEAVAGLIKTIQANGYRLVTMAECRGEAAYF